MPNQSNKSVIDFDSRVIAIIASYNGGDYLRLCVESLVNQVPKRPRIIVIDDASTDHSIESLEQLISSGVVEVHRNSKNLGRADSVNQIFNKFDPDFFILQDADDLAKPNRVSRQVAFMDANPEVACSSTFVEYINANGDYVADGKLDLLHDQRLQDYLTGDEPFGLYCPAIILRSSVVKDPTLQFRKAFWPADDIDLWNRIAEKGHKVRAQPEKLVCYRVHGNSAVTSGFKRTRMQFEWLRACLRARRKGKAEPTKEEFLAVWNAAPFWQRWNRGRKFLAKGFYRAAGFAVAEKSYLKAMVKALVAVILQPSYSVRRAFAQLRGKFC
jgi:glycosyltransferase involved in cell wall biosynthesis